MEVAKKSEIAEYLDKNENQILVIKRPEMSAEERRALLDRIKNEDYRGSDLGLPTWEKGQKIFNWILNVSD